MLKGRRMSQGLPREGTLWDFLMDMNALYLSSHSLFLGGLALVSTYHLRIPLIQNSTQVSPSFWKCALSSFSYLYLWVFSDSVSLAALLFWAICPFARGQGFPGLVMGCFLNELSEHSPQVATFRALAQCYPQAVISSWFDDVSDFTTSNGASERHLKFYHHQKQNSTVLILFQLPVPRGKLLSFSPCPHLFWIPYQPP